MNRSVRTVSILGIIVSCSTLPIRAQQEKGGSSPVPEWLNALRFDHCSEDIPAPRLLAEPRYTQGSRNIIWFTLPPLSEIPFQPVTDISPRVITHVNDGSGMPPLVFPKPVELTNPDPQFESVPALRHGARYTYTTKLFVYECKFNCDAIVDTIQVELHCSAFEDTVWSIQDSQPPLVENVQIPQLISSPVPEWSNQSTIQIEADVTDAAGVWQAFLFRRGCSQTDWRAAVADTNYSGQRADAEFIFAESVRAVFNQTLPDGCYEFRVEGRDATHTPESHFQNFALAGNGGQPSVDAPAQVRIQIDTTPPNSVSLRCVQKLNTIELKWTAARDPEPGIGLAGYRIYRDGVEIATVSRTDSIYVDRLSQQTRETEFTYQVQPVDSLGNVQTTGGEASCRFIPTPLIMMVAEPEFTPGLSNQVCWRGSPIITSYTLFHAKECVASAVATVVADTCFTFTDLEDGIRYCYWVEAVDRTGRAVRSDTVFSIQDATPPKIDRLAVLNARKIKRSEWTNTSTIELHLRASDQPPGGIRTIELIESMDAILPGKLEPIQSNLDTTLFFTLQSGECQPINITARVKDAAGNPSADTSVIIYLDKTPPTPVTEVNCRQLERVNGIRLEWSPSEEPPLCSGLAGYQISRDGLIIAKVHADSSGYDDIFPSDTPSRRVSYQIQPVDSLDNVQITGGMIECDYIGVSQISVEPLPGFTAGLSREVCWSVSGALASLQLFLDEGCNSSVDDSIVLQSLTSAQCHTFENLRDGQSYCYWLVGNDEQQRVVKSDTVRSIQDNTAPVIENVLFRGDSLDGRFWVYDRLLKFDLIARDAPPGEVREYEIIENNLPPWLEAVNKPSARINEPVIFPLQSVGNSPIEITLSIRVFDGAENPSTVRTLRVFLQENLPRMFAFPNPFNPMTEPATIRLSDPAETELKIYDFFGNLVQTLTYKPNSHDFVWDGRNGRGERVANGGYICVGTKTRARFKIGVVKSF